MTLPVFFLSSCSNEILPSNKSPVLSFSSVGSFIENENVVTFNLVAKDKDDITIKIISPAGAQGLTFKKNNDKTVVSYKDLEVKNDEVDIIKGSFISDILNILRYFEQKSALNVISSENGITTYSGTMESGDFEVEVYDSSGFIKEIRCLKHNLVVTLSDHERI